MYPSIDHSFLSPSGHQSKRNRDAYMKRFAKELFPPGYWEDVNKIKQPTEKENLLRHAKTLRDLADAGMNSKKYYREAEKMEKLAEVTT